jgi:hypothetical protein
MWGGTPTPYGPCSFCYDPYHHVRNCPSIRQISNNIFGHKNTSLSRPGNDSYFDSYNPTWSQQSSTSWQAQNPGIQAQQFHGLQHQSYQQFYDHTYSCQSAPQQQYQAEPPPPEVSEELLETIKEMTQNTQKFFDEMRALYNKQADILKEEEEAYQEKPSSNYWPPQCQEEEPPPIYDHSYSHQQYQEEPPSPAMVALQEAMVVSTEMSAALERTMSAFFIQAVEDRQEFERTNNSITQSYEKMDAHFEQMMDILKEEKSQDQLVANHNEYYMEDEYTYYQEQTTTTPRNKETVEENFCEPSFEDHLGEHLDQFYEQAVIEIQVGERKEEQTEDLEEPHQEKEESTKTFSTLALIPETPRGQERSLLELPNEQIEDIKIEKLPESSSYFIPVHDEKLFEKTQSGPPQYTNNWNPPAMGRRHSLWCKRRKDWCFKFKVPTEATVEAVEQSWISSASVRSVVLRPLTAVNLSYFYVFPLLLFFNFVFIFP